MNTSIYKLLSQSLGFTEKQIEKTIELLDSGATIPFISRYRKEATGSLDEVQIGNIKEAYDKLCETEKRKKFIISTIEEQGKLSEELKQRIDSCWDITELEDIYLPYKPRRRTRAEIAREHGLEPLAKIIMAQKSEKIKTSAARFVTPEIPDEQTAVEGACDIIAEWVSENERARNTIRRCFEHSAVVHAKVIKGKEIEGDKYRDYFEWSEPLRRCASHKILAVRRGENEGILRVSITPDDDTAIERLQQIFIKGSGETSNLVDKAIKDSYKRLLRPSIESEFAAASKEKADNEAIRIFAENVRQLLLAPPLGQKRVLAIDPGFRTGCKVVCLDAQGNLLHNETIYPHPPRQDSAGAARKLTQLVESYKIEAIAIGNGTAGRETEQFVTNLRYDRKIQVFVVSESGASIYSASKVAREEFPEHDVTVRGAVSIGRRLIDPLAELVKIDPKSIGVGQYQHDVDQTKLKKSLDRTIEFCVNSVGGKRKHRQQAPAHLYIGIRSSTRSKHSRLSQRERRLRPKNRLAQSTPHGSQSVRTSRRVPSYSPCTKSTRQFCRPPGTISHRRKNGGRSELHRKRSDRKQRDEKTTRPQKLHIRRCGYAHFIRHHRRTRQARPGPPPLYRNDGIRRQSQNDRRLTRRNDSQRYSHQHYPIRLFRRHRYQRKRISTYLANGRPIYLQSGRDRLYAPTG